MLGFLIIFGAMVVMIGLPIVLSNLGRGRKRFVKGLIKAIVFISAISGLFYVGIMFSYKSDVKKWNNGQHKNCGQWELFDIERTRYSNDYYYKCNECGKTIDLSTNFTK